VQKRKILHCQESNLGHLKKISCGYTKSEAIVTEVLASVSVKEIINMLNLNMVEGMLTVFLFIL
jgi:hypothetical protein